MNPAPQTLVTSAASVPTDRPDRYGKQLAGHFSHKIPFEWDAETKTGTGTFAEGAGQVTLVAAEGSLDLALVTTPELVERLEGVIGGHLVRFGAKDELRCHWSRNDGTEGTEQTHTADEAEAHHAAGEASAPA